ncbi:MAG: nicotinamide-nucleotide amidohydrolase family protein [Spirochaetales bacterium]|nr:nicotinamide-nucleotide amidohydrolase family protein [Spirochaetales bacterium]
MPYKNTCVLVLIGSEIVTGEIGDQYQKLLGRELTNAGFSITKIIQIPDIGEILEKELVNALNGNSLIVTTGGLGPTTDDITREIIAEISGVPLRLDEKEWSKLKKRFWDPQLAEINKKQAMIPEGFTVLENEHGTAAGFTGMVNNLRIASLPGPPSELKAMFFEKLLPFLKEISHTGLRHRTTGSAFLISESLLEQALQEVCDENCKWSTRLEPDRVIFNIESTDLSLQQKCFQKLETRFGKPRIRQYNKSISEIVFEKLLQSKKTFCSVESCTGGLIGKWMTDLPGSSEVYWGGCIVYSNDAKNRLVGVDQKIIAEKGAVSGETASEMSLKGAGLSKADFCVAVTGIAGPSGGSKDKPVGTVWISVCARDGKPLTLPYFFKGNRDIVRRKTAVMTLILLESLIEGKKEHSFLPDNF